MTGPGPNLDSIRAALAPTGILRAAINLGNPLLVTGETADGDPVGVSPDMAAEVARRLDVGLLYVPYPSPGELGDDAGADAWDIGLIAAEPKRAETIDFTAPYCEIEATYLVPEGSPLTSVDVVDQPGVRIAISARSAFDLYLTRTLQHAELVRAEGLSASLDLFRAEDLDALAGLRPGLLKNAKDHPGTLVLDGHFTTVQQAIGAARGRAPDAVAFLEAFVADAKSSGLVAELIERHGVTGRLLVAS
jgi:polar amino acid transport system substrate-binding protein